MTAKHRIPDAEMTAFPWWIIVDPPTVYRLEDREPAEVDEENGVHADDVDEDGMMACHHLTPGDVALRVTGPFFSRASAQAHLDARRLDIDPAHLLWLAGLHRATLAEILGGGE